MRVLGVWPSIRSIVKVGLFHISVRVVAIYQIVAAPCGDLNGIRKKGEPSHAFSRIVRLRRQFLYIRAERFVIERGPAVAFSDNEENWQSEKNKGRSD